MIIFVKLILAHIIGDFILQPSKWVEDKELKKEKSKYLYYHVLVHFILIMLFVPKINFIIYAIVLAIFHGLIDFIKLHFQNNKTKRAWFLIDQILHVISIFFVASVYLNLKFDYDFFTNDFWIITTALVLITKPTSIIIKNVINKCLMQNKKSFRPLSGNYISQWNPKDC